MREEGKFLLPRLQKCDTQKVQRSGYGRDRKARKVVCQKDFLYCPQALSIQLKSVLSISLPAESIRRFDTSESAPAF